jgi:molecular chaperone DnaK (HSP70)
MTTTTILPIILGLLLALIFKKYYSFIIKKIDIDIEKQKGTETEAKVDEKKQKEADKERYWLIRHQEDLEETLAKIERITKQRGEIGWNYFSDNILKLAKKLSHFLDKEDRDWGTEFNCFRHLLLCYFFEKPELEKYIEDLSSQYRGKQQELQKKQDELLQKQQELELREAKIIKIESAQKILNSELVEKINKEID